MFLHVWCWIFLYKPAVITIPEYRELTSMLKTSRRSTPNCLTSITVSTGPYGT